MAAPTWYRSRRMADSFGASQRAGSRNSGNSTSAIRVICHDRNSIAMSVAVNVAALPTTLDKVEVNACCAPITSELSRDTSDPVWVRVKNATGCCCTWSNTWVRRS